MVACPVNAEHLLEHEVHGQELVQHCNIVVSDFI